MISEEGVEKIKANLMDMAEESLRRKVYDMTYWDRVPRKKLVESLKGMGVNTVGHAKLPIKGIMASIALFNMKELYDALKIDFEYINVGEGLTKIKVEYPPMMADAVYYWAKVLRMNLTMEQDLVSNPRISGLRRR